MITPFKVLTPTIFLIVVGLSVVAVANSAFATLSKTETKIITEERDGKAVTKIETKTEKDADIDVDDSDNKVTVTITDPINSDGNGDDKNREAREKLQDTRDKIDQLEDDLKDEPNSEPSEAVERNIDDADNDITEACEEQDAPCSEPS